MLWKEHFLGNLSQGSDILSPRPRVATSIILPAALRDRVEVRLARWFDEILRRAFAPLFTIPTQKISGPARGLVFQLREGLGSITRSAAEGQLKALSVQDKTVFRSSRIRIGPQTVFIASLLKPRVRALRALLWAIWNNEEVPNLPPPGLTTLSKNGEVAREFYEAIGFVEIGDLFIRADILDRVSTKLIRQAKSGVFSLPDDFPPSLGLNLSKTHLKSRLNFTKIATALFNQVVS